MSFRFWGFDKLGGLEGLKKKKKEIGFAEERSREVWMGYVGPSPTR